MNAAAIIALVETITGFLSSAIPPIINLINEVKGELSTSDQAALEAQIAKLQALNDALHSAVQGD